MKAKHPIYPLRVRQVPHQFSWIDHRLVRDRHIESCSHAAAALYLFLVTVSDREGLSYYSDSSIMTRLAMDAPILEQARANLVRIGLIAYESPLYQVLSLEPTISASPTGQLRPSMDQGVSIGRLFKQMMGESS